MPWKDRMGKAILFFVFMTIFVLMTFNLVSWDAIVARRIWSGLGALACLFLTIQALRGKDC